MSGATYKAVLFAPDGEWTTDCKVYRNARVMQLATYNSEVGRGLVHTPEWVAFMEKEQAWFNSQQT
jgi:hypothetical protein